MNHDSHAGDESCNPGLTALLDEYLRAWRAGMAVDPESFRRLHAEHASQLAELLPAMLLAEKLYLDPASAQLTSDMNLPCRLGPYTLVREIGRGGMGIVYEAIHPELSQRFAVKVLHRHVLASRPHYARFLREVEAASRLHHAHIVPSKAHGMEADRCYLVMPLIDGVSLDGLLRYDESNDPDIVATFTCLCSNPKRIAKFGAQVASALSHAHRLGMVHRDIKPANLLLSRDGNAWVVDFGLVKPATSEYLLSDTGDVVGTFKYMSPEQVFGLPDERSDIYGLGISLYELLTLQSCRSVKRQHDDHATGSALSIPDIRTLNREIPEALARIVMKACQHHPEDRYQTAQELEHDLNMVAFEGQSDRRANYRRQQGLSSPLVPWVTTLSLLLLMSAGTLTFLPRLRGSSPPRSEQASEPPRGFVPPTTNCVVYKEPGTSLATVIVAVSSRSDDVEQYGKGIMYLDSTDLEMTWDEEEQVIGLRFAGVEIPPRAIIKSAQLCFYAERTEETPTTLRIYGIDDPNPPTFSPVAYDLTNRRRTAISVPWEPGPTTRDKMFESASCAEIVQYLVDLPDWNSGNAMGFVIDGKGERVATAYDGNIHYGPMLKIQYELPANDGSSDLPR